MRSIAVLLVASAFVFIDSGVARAVVPDNGSGTAALPIRSDYIAQTPMHIANGLPAGSSNDNDAVLPSPVAAAEQVGGTLGGTRSGGGGPLFTWTMHGVGLFAGYNRTLSFPPAAGGAGVLSFSDPAFSSVGGSFEVHAAPRISGDPVQSFDTDMFRMFSQITGDPDFDLLRVTAGTDFGMPSPGHTTLTRQLGGTWAVDSFFDVTYRIDFVGHPGGTFEGMSGSTIATVRLAVAPDVPEPATLGILATVLIFLRRRAR